MRFKDLMWVRLFQDLSVEVFESPRASFSLWIKNSRNAIMQLMLGKPFYNGLIKYICSSPIMAMVWEGENCVAAIRQTMGATNPIEAQPGTIRHDLALITSRNLTHASDSPESAEQEISLWFSPNEVFPWNRDGENWITGKN